MTKRGDSPKRLARPENRRVTVLGLAAVAILVLVFGSLAVRGPLQRRFESEAATAASEVKDPIWIVFAAFDELPGDGEVAKEARAALIAALDQSPRARSVPDVELRVALMWARLPDTTRIDVRTARAIGLQHGARAVIGGRVQGGQDGHSIELHAIEPSTGEVLLTLSSEVRSHEELMGEVGALAAEIGAWAEERFGEEERTAADSQ